MKRPRGWIRVLVLSCAALLLGEYVALTVLAPGYVLRAMQQIMGGKVSVDRVRLSLPFTTSLSGLRLSTNTEDSAFAIQRAVIAPRRLSLSTNTLWIDAVTIDRPVIRATQTREGLWRWPRLPASGHAAPVPAGGTHPSGWQLYIDSLKIIDGALIFIDEKPSTPFHGMIDHLSVSTGPLTVPLRDLPISFAVRGELVGDEGHAAPFYCSGWIAPLPGDLQASCQLEPLALAAFEPYLRGPREIRVYGSTAKLTSQWSAAANVLDARLQLELGHLSEGGLTVRGRTAVNLKRFTTGQDDALRGEVHLTGPMNQPQAWYAEFIPGDEQVQGLTKRLLDRGVEMVRVPLWNRRLNLSLVPASQSTMSEIDAASKQIQDALEILSMPAEEPAAPAESAAAPPTVVPTRRAETAPAAPDVTPAAPPTPGP